ncbi:hypothetical protein BaRGS_00006483 [Batillaria attramentaria]|uniref:Uncharacterized protein n=1 Tax=Batillaria attramentaria TaxID=370345 RepID=A0ABD0LSY6_9CAEN
MDHVRGIISEALFSTFTAEPSQVQHLVKQRKQRIGSLRKGLTVAGTKLWHTLQLLVEILGVKLLAVR